LNAWGGGRGVARTGANHPEPSSSAEFAQTYFTLPAAGGGSLRGEFYAGHEINADSVRTLVVAPSTANPARLLRAGANPNHLATDMLGWYVLAVQNFGERFQAAVRYDVYDPNVDLDHDQFERWSFGVNAFYDGFTRLTLSYDAIRTDAEWQNGDYTAQPRGLRTAIYLLLIAGSAPLQMQKNLPTRAQAEKYLDDYVQSRMATTDANAFLYQVDASRNYNPSLGLEKITAPVMYINSADDFINPPELGIAEREIAKVKRGRFVMLPISDETRGHGTHTRARVWKQYLEELLQLSAR